MYKLADLMEKHAEEFAQLETLVSRSYYTLAVTHILHPDHFRIPPLFLPAKQPPPPALLPFPRVLLDTE